MRVTVNGGISVGGDITDSVIVTGGSRKQIINVGGEVRGLYINSGDVIINGKDYSGKIPAGSTVDIQAGVVYLNGKVIE